MKNEKKTTKEPFDEAKFDKKQLERYCLMDTHFVALIGNFKSDLEASGEAERLKNILHGVTVNPEGSSYVDAIIAHVIANPYKFNIGDYVVKSLKKFGSDELLIGKVCLRSIENNINQGLTNYYLVLYNDHNIFASEEDELELSKN